MRFRVLFVALAFTASVAQAATARTAVPVPSQAELAIYVPPSSLTGRAYLPVSNMWIEPGKALSDALQEVGSQYFPKLHVIPSPKDERYGLLLDLAPKWTPTVGKAHLTLQYDVYAADGSKVHSGSADQTVGIKGGNFNAAALNAARLAVQQAMADVQGRLKPDPARFPANGYTSKIDLRPLVDHDKPFRTGTAFFVNTVGQLLTAAHVSRDCVLMEAHQDGVTFPVTAKVASDLLDVAVLDSGKPRDSALSLRKGYSIVLGEAITSVGYPLQGVLGDSPNVTRGNISASKGIRGSLGMLQFSAPIQPGNSGGPIVSDNGELLGVTVGTLNSESLAKRGVIPQNVNFALDARYVAMFLQREKVSFAAIEPKGAGSLQAANGAALSNTVQINCYQ
jgi:serine protease Do